MHDPFGGESGEDLLTMSHGGRRPDEGSLPLKRGGDGNENEMKFVTTPVKIAQREACDRGCANGPAMWGNCVP